MAKGPFILWIFLLLAVAAIALMVAVALSSLGPPLEQRAVQQKGYAIRRWWLITLTATLAALFGVTVPFFPYPRSAAAGAPLQVKVIARQYGFEMPAVLPVDRPIVFAVTSSDVNHGFGIYDAQNEIIAQVQAMPDYVNHLTVVFTRTGRYTVRCLEYCGIGHEYMQGAFDVR